MHAAPGSPPTALIMLSSTATILTLTWGPPDTPNGIITGYTLYVDYNNRSTAMYNVNNETRSYALQNLRPYQNVSVQVSARTSVGEGPRSDNVVFTTEEGSELIVSHLKLLFHI